MLSEAEENYRIGKFTGSLANAVMTTTSEAELVRIWRVKVGLDPPEPETWPMRAGAHMERLILDERELQTGHPITRRGEIVDHPAIPKVCVKLDGYRAHDDAVVECKFLGPYRTKDDFIPGYYAQCMLQKLCTGASNMVLVVAQGTSDPVEYQLVYSQGYAEELMRRAAAFLLCMQMFTPPCALPPVIPPEKWRTVDVIAEPTNWSAELLAHLVEYGATADAAALHDEAGKAARGLVPDDVGKVLAGPWQLARNRKGIISITRRAA